MRRVQWNRCCSLVKRGKEEGETLALPHNDTLFRIGLASQSFKQLGYGRSASHIPDSISHPIKRNIVEAEVIPWETRSPTFGHGAQHTTRSRRPRTHETATTTSLRAFASHQLPYLDGRLEGSKSWHVLRTSLLVFYAGISRGSEDFSQSSDDLQ